MSDALGDGGGLKGGDQSKAPSVGRPALLEGLLSPARGASATVVASEHLSSTATAAEPPDAAAEGPESPPSQ